MFLQTALLYPSLLAGLCLGAGLLVDRCCGGSLPGPLIAVVGAAGLIALSQLLTYAYPLASATPYCMAALALLGWGLGRRRAGSLAGSAVRRPGPVLTSGLAYLLCLAPVLAAGRPTFSSYMALSDSAVHMIGADFLLHHGQHYAHLDLSNSYGLFIDRYYNTSYPSGADTLFGGSALLLGLPLIWAFQPFNAFMLALGVGPAWMLARAMGLRRGWALAAALAAVLPALVYAYELLGSVKEIASIPMILALGVLVATDRGWLRGGPARVIPFALVLAAGVSTLGIAFGAWGLLAVLVLAMRLLAEEELDAPARRRRVLGLGGVLVAVVAVAAWPTWAHLGGSLRVAGNIATTSNPGNLPSSLGAVHVMGIWLRGSYKLAPAGTADFATHALVGVAVLAALLGTVQLARLRAVPLGAWLGLMLLAWALITAAVTAWAGAKTLVLTSPAVMLLAWGGVALLRSVPSRAIAMPAAGILALALLGGVAASDALQYHESDLAPTARYDELASVASRFAGGGPVLFTDFDEYSLYQLRRLDPGGPSFVYPPPALAVTAGGYGRPVRLQRAAPAALAAYPLVVTRRDPSLLRPPAAYRLAWQGNYYRVWRRVPGAAVARAQRPLVGTPAQQCRIIGGLARSAPGGGGRLLAAVSPVLVNVPIRSVQLPPGWGRERRGVSMRRPGRLSVGFHLPVAGRWQVWVKGQVMPTLDVSVDGRALGSLAGQVGGNSLVPNTAPPLGVTLSAGAHRLTLRRLGATLAPGDGGQAVLAAVYLTPGSGSEQIQSVPARRWRDLCRGSHQWVELLAGS